jgi:ribosomal protein L37AE/L43A
MDGLGRMAGVVLVLGSILCSALAWYSPLFSFLLWPIAGLLLISGLWGLITGSNSQATRLELEQHMHLSLMKEQQRSSQAVCPQCQKVVLYDRSLAGLGVRCGGCGHQFQVF